MPLLQNARAAEERITEAEASKTEYETLIAEITAVQRRARK